MTSNNIIKRAAAFRAPAFAIVVALGLGVGAIVAYAEGAATTLERFAVWQAILLPPPGAKPAAEPGIGKIVGGAATLKEDAGSKQTDATVTVTNAAPGSVLPWHVHTGTCEKSGGIYGPPQAYTPVHIGADGAGTVSVKLPFTLPSSGTYVVNVHRSVDDLPTIVACGKLTRE
jgi:superoxide dismutase, Cu-Zn family